MKITSISIVSLALTAVVGIGFIRIHVANEMTNMGYQIGKLKKEEMKLLEKQSLIKMELAKLTTREHLALMANQPKTSYNPLSVAKN